jgi:hypothetical protein
MAVRTELSAMQWAYESIWHSLGQWGQQSVKWIDSASLYLQKGPQAYLALIGANIIFFELALAVSRLANFLFNQCQGDFGDLESDEKTARSLVLGLVYVITLGGANWAFCNMVRLPISPLKVTVVSILTCSAYLFYKTR